ncbi:hypothetical protein BHM03_00003081, partial [Ensete ventricosum]
LETRFHPFDSMKQDNDQSHRNLLAMTVGIKQKLTVDAIVRKVLLQNDLIHGWGMDMKLGYCAQVDLLY